MQILNIVQFNIILSLKNDLRSVKMLIVIMNFVCGTYFFVEMVMRCTIWCATHLICNQTEVRDWTGFPGLSIVTLNPKFFFMSFTQIYTRSTGLLESKDFFVLFKYYRLQLLTLDIINFSTDIRRTIFRY